MTETMHKEHRWILAQIEIGEQRSIELLDMPFSDEQLERHTNETQSRDCRWLWWKDVPPDVSQLLTMNRFERRQAFEAIKRVGQHIAKGHYNTALRDKMSQILSIERHPELAAKIQALPDREFYGVHETWCEAALNDACRAMHGALSQRAMLVQAAINAISIDPCEAPTQ